VHESGIKELSNFNKYDLEIWKNLINIHLKKANFITKDSFTIPIELISQLVIFSKQIEKFIYPNSKVAVLSSFPIFLHDYYGNEELKRRIE
jgi:hypothetical protein